MNKIDIIGRITHDLKVNFTKDNKKYLVFNIAVNEYVKDKYITYYFKCLLFNKVDPFIKYCKKGTKIAISGKLINRNNAIEILVNEYDVLEIKIKDNNKSELLFEEIKDEENIFN